MERQPTHRWVSHALNTVLSSLLGVLVARTVVDLFTGEGFRWWAVAVAAVLIGVLTGHSGVGRESAVTAVRTLSGYSAADSRVDASARSGAGWDGYHDEPSWQEEVPRRTDALPSPPPFPPSFDPVDHFESITPVERLAIPSDSGRFWQQIPIGATGNGSSSKGAPPTRDAVVQPGLIHPWNNRQIELIPFLPSRREATKRAFSTRRVPEAEMATLIEGAVRPRAGDLVLARVDRLGSHIRLELTSGRRANLNEGDEIILAYANRYASDQFESYVPSDLGSTQLAAAGGIASTVRSKNADVRRATDITPIGLIADTSGRVLNLARFSLPPIGPPEIRPPTLAVIGTSMSSGKTTTITCIVRGLHGAGRVPGVTKVTGTGAGNDYWATLDAGARMMIDFTDAGLASTYMADLGVVEQTASSLIDHVAHRGCDAILVEVADGILQRETAHLLASESFHDRIDGVIIAASDALGAVGAVEVLRAMGLKVVAIAGRLSRAPLAVAEASKRTGLPVMSLDELSDPVSAVGLFAQAGPRAPELVVDLAGERAHA